MEVTSNYLKNALQALKQGNKWDTPFIAALLLLAFIPLPYAYSSAALGIFVIERLVARREQPFPKQYILLLPIALFLLMALSSVWSINTGVSVKAISKYLPFLLIPGVLLFKPYKNFGIHKFSTAYSWLMAAYALYYLVRAGVRYTATGNAGVFFYHELVTKDVNAIHVSAYMAVAFCSFLQKRTALAVKIPAMLLLGIVILLLSSKNIIVVFLLLVLGYFFAFSQVTKKAKWAAITALAAIAAGSVLFVPNINKRFVIETQTAFTPNTVNKEIGNEKEKVYNITIARAWKATHFEQNEYFPGTAFRVYQARIFFEMVADEPLIIFTGYGLNATEPKIQQKADEYSLYPAYGAYNFHNQYIQLFAETGIVGLLLLLLMLGIKLKNAFASKDFTHIAFSILMITLFLTESLLSRQRGIIFFVGLYCLFNAARGRIDEKSEL